MSSGEVAVFAAFVLLALFISLTCVRYVYCRSILYCLFGFDFGPFSLVLHKYATKMNLETVFVDRRQTAPKRFIVLYIKETSKNALAEISAKLI